MRKILVTLLLTLAAVGVVRAQGEQPKQNVKAPAAPVVPTVDQIIDKYVQAVGGKEAFGKLSSRVRKGTLEIVGTPIKGATETYEKGPNKKMTKTTLPDMGSIQQGYDGKSGWRLDPNTGLNDARGGELADLAFDSEFNREIRMKELYPSLEFKGVQKVNGRDAYLLLGTPAGQEPEKLYFDTQSGLLVRQDVVHETAGDKATFEVYFDDYREVDGVKIAFAERQSAPEFVITIKYQSVQHNIPIDDAIFSKPPRK